MGRIGVGEQGAEVGCVRQDRCRVMHDLRTSW